MNDKVEEFKRIRYTHIPGDFYSNDLGFKNDARTCIYSDISAHLPFLEFLAHQCEHVTEFGARECYSTIALISGAKNKVVSYDIKSNGTIEYLLSIKNDLPCNWEFVLQDTIEDGLEIEQTDFLFIDTLHTYNQVKKELELHANKVNRWIGFHDTFSHGIESLDVLGEEGINRAINEFISQNNWKVVYQVQFNHGLTLIERY